MANDLQGCLRSILGTRFRVDPTDQGEIRLKERQARMTTTLLGVTPGTTALRLEKVGHIGNLSHDSGLDILRVCDYALIEDRGETCETTLVEMKKTLRDTQAAFEQLRRSKPIVDYLLSVCSVELQRTWDHTIKYILIAEREQERLDKRRMRGTSRPEIHKDIEVTVAVGTHLHLRTVVGRNESRSPTPAR